MSLALIALVGSILCCNGTEEWQRAAELWSSRARRTWASLFVAYALLNFAVASGVAGVASPFVAYAYSINNFSFSYYYSAFVGCGSFTGFSQTIAVCASNVGPSLVAGIYVVVGLGALSFPAAVIAGVAAVRVRRVVSAGAMPPVGCCRDASLPAATVLSWIGLSAEVGGGANLWVTFALISSSTQQAAATGGVTVSGGLSAGSGLLAASIVAHFIANVVLSAACCCCVGNLPGIGCARRCCCCAETDVGAVPAEAVVRPLAAYAPTASALAPAPRPTAHAPGKALVVRTLRV